MKAFILAALMLGVSAQAESDFFGLPVTPAPRATPAPGESRTPPASAAQPPGSSGPVGDIKAIVDRISQEVAKVSAAEASALAPVKSAYVRDLERFRDSASARADLDGMVAAEAALLTVQGGKAPSPAKAAVLAVEQLRTNYEKSKAQALRTFEPQRSRLDADYSRQITELEQRFMRAGNLDAAREAHEAQFSPPAGIAVDVMPSMTGDHEARESYFVVKGDDQHLRTAATFRPPLEIEYVFKTDGQIRFRYACDELILNWEGNKTELRIGGGPANGQHRAGMGSIPTKQMLTVKQVILADEMTLSVDGHERGKWTAAFSGVDQAIELWGSHGSTVWLKQIIVRKLP